MFIYKYIYLYYIQNIIYNIYNIYIIQPLKNEVILPFVTMWIDLEGIMLSEINQRNTTYHMISLLCGI